MIAPALVTQRGALSRVRLAEDRHEHMTLKDDLHHLVDELDEEAARQALAYLQTLRLPRTSREAPRSDVIHDEDLDRELRNELRKE